MDGEHIEKMLNGWASSELRERAFVELGKMREELYILRQLTKGERPTQKRKPGWKTLTEIVGGKHKPSAPVCPVCESDNAFTAVICVNCGSHTAPRE